MEKIGVFQPMSYVLPVANMLISHVQEVHSSFQRKYSYHRAYLCMCVFCECNFLFLPISVTGVPLLFMFAKFSSRKVLQIDCTIFNAKPDVCLCWLLNFCELAVRLLANASWPRLWLSTCTLIYVSTAVRINPKSGFEFRARSVQSFVAHLFPK